MASKGVRHVAQAHAARLHAEWSHAARLHVAQLRVTNVRVGVLRYELPFRSPLLTASGAHRARHGYIVCVTDRGGRRGYGDLAPLPGHSRETLDAALAGLRKLARVLEAESAPGDAILAAPDSLGALACRLCDATPALPSARAALILALADLGARRAGVPLAKWLSPTARPQVAVNATIGIERPEIVARLAREAVAGGFTTLKLKLGADVGMGIAGAAAVREAVGAPIWLRADANGAWDERTALSTLEQLAGYGLQFVEQPVPAADVPALARISQQSGIPIAADESLLEPDGVERVLGERAAQILVLKPSLLGGPLEALSVAAQATEAGARVVVTTALESVVGRLGALHLAAALPASACPYACGLATGQLLAGEVSAAPIAENGEVAVPTRPGLGIEIPGDFEELAPEP